MTTIQIVTKNNSDTIKNTLESLKDLSEIVVADLGSDDDTVDICKSYNVVLYNLANSNVLDARRYIAKKYQRPQFCIEPWEIIVQGRELIANHDGSVAYAKIISNEIFLKEVRFWNHDTKLINPIFCEPEIVSQSEKEVTLYASGGPSQSMVKNIIQVWKENEPLNPKPLFHEACLHLANNKIDEFLNTSKQYLFLDRTNSNQALILRYYCGYIFYSKFKDHKSSLQYANLCVAAKPLFAEFWCFMGDIFCHLLNDYRKAIEMYENAIVLGSKRKSNEKFPLDIKKYKSYPKSMIEKCKLCLSKIDTFQLTSKQNLSD